MVNNVVLGQAIRSSITTLQQIERTVDTTTLRLASGLEVNSALDDPQNFFSAKALGNEAQDLEKLIDDINQRVLTLQETNTGIETLEQLLQQAEAVTIEAIDEIRSAEPIAELVGNTDIGGTVLSTLNGIAAGTVLTVSAGDGEGNTNTASVTIDANTTGRGLAASISNLSDLGLGGLDVEAEINDNGQLVVRSTSGDFVRIDFGSTGTGHDAITSIGFDQTYDFDGGITAIPDSEIRSQRLFRTDGGVARYNDKLRDGAVTPIITGEDGRVFDRIRAEPVPPGTSDSYFISVNGQAEELENFFRDGATIIGDGVTLGQFVDRINFNPNLNTQIEAEFDRDSGQIVIRPLSTATQTFSFRIFEAGGNNLDTAFGFGTSLSDQARGVGGNNSYETIVFGHPPSGKIEQLQGQLDELRAQIDQLVNDANYRGANLLKGETIETFFNSNLTSRLVTEGANFTSDGLGLTGLTIENEDAAEDTLEEVREAILDVRSFGTTIVNDIAIIEARSTFTEQTINTFKAGADDLTVADQNEEGANLLALQTRQSIATSALSFASQLNQNGITTLVGG